MRMSLSILILITSALLLALVACDEVTYEQCVEEFNEVCEVEHVGHLIPRLFKRIVKSISGDHLQVADRAMCFFENDYFLNILKYYKQ